MPGGGNGIAAAQFVDQHRTLTADQLHRRAAVLIATGGIGRQHNLHLVGGLQQQFGAEGVEILVVIAIVGARACAGHYFHPAVTVTMRHIHTQRRVVTQWRIDATGQAQRTVIAKCHLAISRKHVVWLACDDIDHTRRCVLAEQGALRPLQHLDAFQFAQIPEPDRVARAEHAINHHPHRRLQANVVAHRANAPQARGGDCLALGAGHGQPRHQNLQILDVTHARVLQGLLRQRGHCNRHVLHDFFALLRSHYHGVQRLRLNFLVRRRGGILRQYRQAGETHQSHQHGDGEWAALWLRALHGGSPLCGQSCVVIGHGKQTTRWPIASDTRACMWGDTRTYGR